MMIQREFGSIQKFLPSVTLARLHRLFNDQSIQKGRVNTLLSMIQLQHKVSELDPDVTLESLKKSVLNLFNTVDESVKEEIYTAVRNVVLEE